MAATPDGALIINASPTGNELVEMWRGNMRVAYPITSLQAGYPASTVSGVTPSGALICKGSPTGEEVITTWVNGNTQLAFRLRTLNGDPPSLAGNYKTPDGVTITNSAATGNEIIEAWSGNTPVAFAESRVFSVTPPTPTLNTLWLSGVLTNGLATTGLINGATTGSTIVSNQAGLTVNSAARTYAWDGTGSAGTVTNMLTESLVGYTTKDSIGWVLGARTGTTRISGTLFFTGWPSRFMVLAGYSATSILTCTSSDGTALVVGTNSQGYPLVRGTFATPGPKTITLTDSVNGVSTMDVLVVDPKAPASLATAKTKAQRIVDARASRVPITGPGVGAPTITVNTGNSLVNGRSLAAGGSTLAGNVPDGFSGLGAATSQALAYIYASTTDGTKAFPTGMSKEWVFTGTTGTIFDAKVSSSGNPAAVIQIQIAYTDNYDQATPVWYYATVEPYTYGIVTSYFTVTFPGAPARPGSRAVRMFFGQSINATGAGANFNFEAGATLAALNDGKLRCASWNDSYLFPQGAVDMTTGGPSHIFADYVGSFNGRSQGHKTNAWGRIGGTTGVHGYVADRFGSNPWGVDEMTFYGALDVAQFHMSVNDHSLFLFVSLATGAAPKFNNAGGSNSFEPGLDTLTYLLQLAFLRARYMQPSMWIVVDMGFYTPDDTGTPQYAAACNTAINAVFDTDYMATLLNVATGTQRYYGATALTGDPFPLVSAGVQGDNPISPPISSVFTGSITGTTLDVTSAPTHPVYPGMVLGVPPSLIGYPLAEQLTGTPGGIGTYRFILAPGDVASSSITMYGDASHLTPYGYTLLGQMPGKALVQSAALCLAA